VYAELRRRDDRENGRSRSEATAPVFKPSMPAAMLRAMRRPRRNAAAAPPPAITRCAAAVAVLAGLALPSSASAAADPSSEWATLARSMAAPWAGLQKKNTAGFADYVVDAAPPGPPRDPYGRAFLGLALLQSGIRDGDDPQIAAGLKAVGYAASHPVRRDRIVFENLALETAYNVARASLGGDARFQAIRPALERRIKRTTVIQFGGKRPYYNYYLVDSAGLMEALASGLRSSVKGSALARRTRTRRLVKALVNTTAPRIGARYSTSDPAGRLAVLSDPPWNPPAYDAFSLALLARITNRLGPAATSDAARELMRRMARSLWVLASPTGSVSYWGRSQDQSWTLAMTAYGALATAHLPGTSPEDAARFEALAARALTRLRDHYAGGRFGFWITPAFADGIRGAIPGIDAYADAASYSGLTLVGLNWALEEMDADGPAPGPLAADIPGVHRISRGPSAVVFVRTAHLWFAVKQGPGVYVPGVGDYRRDVRYDSGLVALQNTLLGEDVIPARPHSRRGDDRAEPVLVRRGQAGGFWGTSLRTTTGGGVDLTGGFRAGSRWLRRGVRVTYRPRGCGLRQSLSTRRGDRIVATVWTRGRPRGTDGGRVRLDHAQRITLGARPRRTSFRGGYASGAEHNLTRVQLLFAGTGKPLTIDFCSRSAAL
jgi:hypothetical protein